MGPSILQSYTDDVSSVGRRLRVGCFSLLHVVQTENGSVQGHSLDQTRDVPMEREDLHLTLAGVSTSTCNLRATWFSSMKLVTRRRLWKVLVTVCSPRGNPVAATC